MADQFHRDLLWVKHAPCQIIGPPGGSNLLYRLKRGSDLAVTQLCFYKMIGGPTLPKVCDVFWEAAFSNYSPLGGLIFQIIDS